MRLWMALALLGALLGGNAILFVASMRQFEAAAAQRQATIAQRHAIEAQREAIDLISQHMREWLAGSRRCDAPSRFGLRTLTDM